jgi:hypothetical protein
MTMFETLAKVMSSSADTLKIHCLACQHRAVWTRQEAFDRLGPDSGPYIVGKKLICERCGARNRASVTV